MAIRHVAQRFCRDTQKIPVFPDSKAALYCIINDKEGSGQGFTRMVYMWERDLLKKNSTVEIIYRWLVTGHRGVPGNEAAHHWTKQRAWCKPLVKA
jgi:hypothetical protein